MNSAVRSLLPAKAKRWVFIGGAVLVLLVLVARLFGDNDTALAALIVGAVCLAALALTWLLISLFLRMGRRKRQRKFDAGIAAREGIDDRKREWHSWVAELEKNNIDRYELPFYLLVGEPQSGKSVLLQNSDLKFLFGQSRLSGIGGTRGCDWWFTEEAVILDLAGRLFTHEGGAADEAEWEAFLDLVNDFRPLDPANGIMLVIPCDGLLGESLEVCAQKANKTREALLSLTRKLEAKLPIYVVLTKADKIFGFAETVHRLSLEQRHQMFGWSRSAERLEEPFDSNELHEAWGGIVQRGAALRDQMLGTLRLPEGLPEVDRMLGFPEELKGMAEPLEAYLNRIFLGSELVDQLYFRGIYLTSGLQSGAPIAKVFLDILDRPGEADGRDLEKLFVRQQAYFIKDLVRKRVFGERGLVKPTSTRVERAKKKAWVGYGLAASVAFVSLIWGAFEIRAYHKASGQDIYDAAISAAAELTPGPLEALSAKGDEYPKVSSLLGALESVQTARDRNPTVMQRLHASRQPHLKALYETIYDDVYRNRLQTVAANTLRATTRNYDPADPSKRPADYDVLIKEATVATTLMGGVADADSARIIASVVPGSIDLDQVGMAHEHRGDGFVASVGGSSVATRAAIEKLRTLWDATLDPVDPVHIGGSVGFCLNWHEMTLFEQDVLEYGLAMDAVGTADPLVHDACQRALLVLAELDAYTKNPNYEVETIPIGEFQREGHELETLRAALYSAGGVTEVPAWDKKEIFVRWLKLNGMGLAALIENSLSTTVDAAVLKPLHDGFINNVVLRKVARANWLGPDADATPAKLILQLKEAIQWAGSDDDVVRSIVRLKLRLARDQFLADYGDWDSIHATLLPVELEGAAAAPETLAQKVITQKFILDSIIDLTSAPDDLEPLGDRLRSFALAGVKAIDASLDRSGLDTATVALLLRTRSEVPGAGADCVTTIQGHILAVRTELDAHWEGLVELWETEQGASAAAVIAADAAAHIRAVRAMLPGDDALMDVGRTVWVKRTSSLLDKRLGVYGGLVQQAVSQRANLDDLADLGAACKRIKEVLIGGSALGALRAWIKKMYTDLRVPKPNDASLATYYGLFPAGESSALKDYKRIAQLGAFERGSEPPVALFRHVDNFYPGSKAIEGKALAKTYYEAPLEFPALDGDPDDGRHGVLLEFSRELSRSFSDIVLAQLRKDYLDELTRRVIGASRSELEEFWYNPAKPRTGVRPKIESVGHFFGDGGEYLRLLDGYSVLEHTGADFRISMEALPGAALDPREQGRWQLDHFMQQMLLYVRHVEELAQLTAEERPSYPLAQIEKLKIELAAYSSESEHEATWNHWNNFESKLFTPGRSTSIQDPVVDPAVIQTEPVLGWGFHEDKVFDLSWQDPPVGSQKAKWQRYELRSSLAPLLLFWSDAKTWADVDVKAQVRTARVDFYVTTDERAPFDLAIDPAPPRRPTLDFDFLLGG